MQKQDKTQTKVTLVDKVIADITDAQKQDANIKVLKVTGYTSIKYGNKVLFELHIKRKSITHLTFSNKQKAYSILKDNNLVMRVVPASYGWKYNTECLLTDEFYKHFKTILKSVIAEAIEQRNLKTTKKVAKVASK